MSGLLSHLPKPKLEDQEIASSDPYAWTTLVRVAMLGTPANATGAHKVMQSLEEPVTLRSILIHLSINLPPAPKSLLGGLLPRNFLTKFLYSFLFPTCILHAPVVL